MLDNLERKTLAPQGGKACTYKKNWTCYLADEIEGRTEVEKLLICVICKLEQVNMSIYKLSR